MANPFLVLGGIAISVATAAFGILQVPGWVASAQDAAAVNDLAGIRSVQAIAASSDGGYIIDPTKLSSDDATLTLSGGVEVSYFEATEDAWCAVVRSASGIHLAGTDGTTDIGRGRTPGTAAADVGCAGFTDPGFTPWEPSRKNLAVNPRAGEFKDVAVPMFGVTTHRFPDRGTYSTVGGWYRFTQTVDHNSSYGFHISSNPEGSLTRDGEFVRVAPGERYAVSMKARTSVGNEAQIRFRFVNDDPAWVSDYIDYFGSVDATGRTVSALVTVPEGATKIAVSVLTRALTQGEHIEITDLLVEKVPPGAAAAGPFFDGSTVQSDPDLVRVRWLGEPGASQSVLETRTRR